MEKYNKYPRDPHPWFQVSPSSSYFPGQPCPCCCLFSFCLNSPSFFYFWGMEVGGGEVCFSFVLIPVWLFCPLFPVPFLAGSYPFPLLLASMLRGGRVRSERMQTRSLACKCSFLTLGWDGSSLVGRSRTEALAEHGGSPLSFQDPHGAGGLRC